MVRCKYCGKEIEISEAITHEEREKIRRELAVQIEATAKAKARADYELATKLQTKEIEEAKVRTKRLLVQLEALMDEVAKLKARDDERELETKKRLVENENKIREEVTRETRERFNLDSKEKDKKLTDALTQIEELKTKIQQKSGQLQGEVLELDLETNLKAAFPEDEINPVGKGIAGGDIVHKVKNRAGKVAGTIIWETKHAKWSPSWIAKLKEDTRAAGATVAVLVTENLPSEVSGFSIIDGILVTGYKYAIPLASLLRRSVMQIASAKFLAASGDESLMVLHQYLQSDAFRHRFEAFYEGIKTMEVDLLYEKRALERIWKKREVQIHRLGSNASNMYGELQGVMGSSLPDIKSLSLDSGGD